MTHQKPKCAGMTKAGTPCKRPPRVGELYCGSHADQGVIDLAQRAGQLRKRAQDGDDADRDAFDAFLRDVTLARGQYKTFPRVVGGNTVADVPVDLPVRLAFGREWAELRGWHKDTTDEGERSPGTVFFAPEGD